MKQRIQEERGEGSLPEPLLARSQCLQGQQASVLGAQSGPDGLPCTAAPTLRGAQQEGSGVHELHEAPSIRAKHHRDSC